MTPSPFLTVDPFLVWYRLLFALFLENERQDTVRKTKKTPPSGSLQRTKCKGQATDHLPRERQAHRLSEEHLGGEAWPDASLGAFLSL